MEGQWGSEVMLAAAGHCIWGSLDNPGLLGAAEGQAGPLGKLKTVQCRGHCRGLLLKTQWPSSQSSCRPGFARPW